MHGNLSARPAAALALVAISISHCHLSQTAADGLPAYAEREDLSYVLTGDGGRSPIRTADDWKERRAHILLGIEAAMGPSPRPASPTPLDVKVLQERRSNGLIWRKLAYHTDRLDQRVTAWLLKPESATPRPAVLCLHQTVAEGKDSPVGLADRPTLHYALELARRGYVTLSPDYPSLGEYDYDFDDDAYASGSMKAIYDNIRAIDLLQSLPEVDPQRIGCIGHSLGGHNGLFTAVFDERLRVVVSCCGFTRFARYMNGDLTGWAGPRYMPRIASQYGKSPERMPFDFTEVIAAIAPRAVLVVAPLDDDNFAVEGVRETIAAAPPVYKLLGSPQNLRVIYPDAGHDFPDEARETAYRMLDDVLEANDAAGP